MNRKLLLVVLASGVLGACAQMDGMANRKADKNASAAPAPATPQSNLKGPPPGMNDKGEVIDSAKIEAGSGRQVKGLHDWEGEITGKCAGTKFDKLQIGMPMREVRDIVGSPSDEGGYITGKAWIPFYFGSDRNRYEQVYQNTGRLIFAGGSIGDWSTGHLIWIICNAHEPKYRE